MCPKIGTPRENLEGMPAMPTGRYTFRLDEFKPAKPKKIGSTSINLNANLTVINHPTLSDRKLFNNANTDFAPSMYDMAHACGIKYEGEDDPSVTTPVFPGEFQCRVHGAACDSSDPQNWQYIGPLAGQVGECEVVDADNGRGGRTTKIGRFLCRIPGCTAKHSDNIAG